MEKNEVKKISVEKINEAFKVEVAKNDAYMQELALNNKILGVQTRNKAQSNRALWFNKTNDALKNKAISEDEAKIKSFSLLTKATQKALLE